MNITQLALHTWNFSLLLLLLMPLAVCSLFSSSLGLLLEFRPMHVSTPHPTFLSLKPRSRHFVLVFVRKPVDYLRPSSIMPNQGSERNSRLRVYRYHIRHPSGIQHDCPFHIQQTQSDRSNYQYTDFHSPFMVNMRCRKAFNYYLKPAVNQQENN